MLLNLCDILYTANRLGDVMVTLWSIVGSITSLVRRKTKQIGICCLPVKHATLLSKRKDWLDRSHDKVEKQAYVYLWNVASLSQHYKNQLGVLV